MSDNSMSSSSRSLKASLDKMTAIEKLTVIPTLLKALAYTYAYTLADVFRGREGRATTLYRHMQYTKIRAITDNLTIRQSHAISPATDTVYATKCKQHGMKADSVVLEDGTRAHWIGPSSAEHIVINFHGGGYVLPASEFMVEFMFRLQALLTTDEKPVAILLLSYDLAPTAHYPRQLTQAVALLQHTVTVLKKDPAKIILCGDSAGGNLAVATLSHLSHPHPDIKPLELPGKLRGAVLVSPWISFRFDTDSFTVNARKDLISLPTGKKWAEAFMGHPPPYPNSDNWNEANRAPVEWWADLNVEEVLIVAGKEEVLVDGIVEWAGKLKQGMGEKRVSLLVAEHEAHDMPSLDLQFGFEEPGEQAKMMRSWIAARL